MAKYSNFRAMRALIRASLQAILKSPSSVIFTIAFPLIFILVFGFLGNNGGFTIRVAAAPGNDTTNFLYTVLHKVDVLRWTPAPDTATANKLIREDDVVAVMDISEQPAGTLPRYKVRLTSPSTETIKAKQLQSIINGVVAAMDPEIAKRQKQMADVQLDITSVREYKNIDFILPGQLSFSLLATGVFGTAFVFFNLRQTLVLKRFFATPVRRHTIVISEGIARMIFQLMGSIVIISLGHFAFGFTLSNGWVTFVEMLVMSAIGLLLFMGFGFIISAIAKSESAIPPFSNMITLPQFLLAGTFFSIDAFPKWLQPICRALPLTYLNHALRKISFEGAHLWDVSSDIGVLLVWMVGVYLIAGRLFKWE